MNTIPPKFLYLTATEWATTWTNGGDVPINKASAYRSQDHSGTLTCDETRRESGVNISGDDADFVRRFIIGPGPLRAMQIDLPGGRTLHNVTIHSAEWDGLVLCFSNRQAKTICRRLRKKACVLIRDPQALFDAVSAQLGIVGDIGECIYTRRSIRDVFTKSYRDAWQDEFRMFWELDRDAETITVPPGTGRHLWSLP